MSRKGRTNFGIAQVFHSGTTQIWYGQRGFYAFVSGSLLSIVRKLGPTKIKRTIKEYYMLYRSRKSMAKRLTAKSIRYTINQLEKGRGLECTARDGASPTYTTCHLQIIACPVTYRLLC